MAEEDRVTLKELPLGESRCAVAWCSPEVVELHWKNSDGEAYMNVDTLKQACETQGKQILFATNSGMFTPKFAPAGLHVEKGETLRPLNTNEGPGNFHLMPNGVFYIDDDGGRVCTTEQYIADAPTPRLATQSGPMLVIDGAIHPKFNEGSPNLRIRSGVGIDENGRVVFAISESFVNFYDFAIFFRDTLHCSNALFLDGALSFCYAPALNMTFSGGTYGGLIAVTTQSESEDE